MYGGINMVAESTHEVPMPCGLILLTDWLLYTTDVDYKHLFIISNKLSYHQVRIDCNEEGLANVSIWKVNISICYP